MYSAAILLLGCGGMELTDKDKEELEALKAEKEAATQKEEAEQADEESLLKSKDPIFLRGYLSSSFAISVDGISFEDSEDFYSAQLDKLEAEKIENGFADYELTLSGRLGLSDLKYGMTVYAESAGEAGFGKETVVVADGTFEVKFPAQASGETFQIRANKRLGVILKNPEGDTIHWCYNFYGRKVSMVDHESKPVILREFFTKLTKYDCNISKQKDDTLHIPQSVSEVVPDDKASTEAQNDQWDREWEEQTEKAKDKAPSQEQIDQWDREWDELILEQNSDTDTTSETGV